MHKEAMKTLREYTKEIYEEIADIYFNHRESIETPEESEFLMFTMQLISCFCENEIPFKNDTYMEKVLKKRYNDLKDKVYILRNNTCPDCYDFGANIVNLMVIATKEKVEKEKTFQPIVSYELNETYIPNNRIMNKNFFGDMQEPYKHHKKKSIFYK